MIAEWAIKDKNFAHELPMIIKKIKAVATGLQSANDVGWDLSEDVHGFCEFLVEIANDLETIDKALYPEVDQNESGKKPKVN
jgi:hypothetical protein